jgi:septal ring factor EnvC (AmiA/AmiB activator)
VPQWLSVRRTEVKAEEAALARIVNHLETLRTQEERLARLMVEGGTQEAAVGGDLMADARYRERLQREREAIRRRIAQAEEALAAQQARVARARRALDVAEDVVAEGDRDRARIRAKREEQALHDLAFGGRRAR